MKKVLSLFLSCIFVLGVCFSTPIVASATGDTTIEVGSKSEVMNGCTYVVTDLENKYCALQSYTDVELSGESGYQTVLPISGTVKFDGVDYTIKSIQANAFNGVKHLETLKIDSTITAVPNAGSSIETIEYKKNESETIIFTGLNAIYTGESQGITATDTNGSAVSVAITYDNKETTDQIEEVANVSAVGSYTATVSLSESEVLTFDFTIDYLPTPENAVTISGKVGNAGKYWFNANETVSITPASDHLIAKIGENGIVGEFGSSVTFSSSDVDMKVQLKNSEEQITDVVTLDNIGFDVVEPTGTITLDENNSWNSLLETITFGLFFKEAKTVTITSADEDGSGVVSIEYYVSEEKIEDIKSANVDWVGYTSPFTLSLGSKNIVYAKITDNVGNVEYISSNGIVLYSDSKTGTENISYTKFSDSTVTVDINLNGNTIKEVKNGDITLSKGAAYEVSESAGVATLTFYKEMLDYLPIGESEITISYNPLGVSSGEDDITLYFTINKATPTFTAPKAKTNLAYNGAEQELIEKGTTTGGTMLYSLTPTDENSWSDDIPKKINAGEYTVYYKVVGDDNYNSVEADETNKVKVTIAKIASSITTEPEANTLTYTGQPQPLVTAGSATGGTMQYGLDNKTWDSNIPTAKDAGTYTVYYKVVGDENHADTEVKSTSVKINKAPVTISVETQERVYDGTNAVKIKSATVSDVVSGETISVKYDGVTATSVGTGVGTHTVDFEGDFELVGETAGNYEIGAVKEATVTITAKLLAITAKDVTVVVNSDMPKFEYTVDGLVDGDSITAVTLTPNVENTATVGEYILTPSATVIKKGDTEVTENYEIRYENGKFTVIVCTTHEWEDGKCSICQLDCEHATWENGVCKTCNTECEHEFDSPEITKNPTCNAPGELTWVCTICEHSKVTTVNPNGDGKTHDWSGDYVVTKAATCVSEGIEIKTCKNGCGQTQTREIAVDTEAHVMGEWVTTEQTCVADGKKVRSCTLGCGATEAEVIKADNESHKLPDEWTVTKEANCVENGEQVKACLNEGCAHVVKETILADGESHNLGEWEVTIPAKCTIKGEVTQSCQNGDCTYKVTASLKPDGKSHSFAEDFTIIEATCITAGSKFKACENEGCKEVAEKTEIAINPDAHKNVETINVKEATCEEKGYTGDEHCNDCKKTFEPGIEINAKGHTESDWIVDKEATFTEEGARHTACTVCKKELKKEVIAKRALETPVVKIENAGNGIKVSWSQDEDATGYTVYRSEYNPSTKKWSKWKNRGTAAATKKNWTDKTVKEGVTYRFTVRSVNGDIKSAYKATSGILYVVAPKVTVSITSTGLLAKWNKINNATSYIVYRAELGADGNWGKWVQLGTTKAEKNTWSDDKVKSGVTYKYTVRAVVGKVKSGYTGSSAIIYLEQPLLKIANAANGITGKWEQVAGATGYTIYRSEYNPSTKKWTKWLNLGTTKATAKSFTDKTAKSGYQYKYTIRAVNGKLKSTYQDSNKLVCLAQPTLKISNVANGIQGKWTKVDGATGYIIYRSELKDGKWTKWITLGTAKATAKSFTDKTVKSGVQYKYTIRAKNGSYKSSYIDSNTSIFLSIPTVKIANAETGVKVTWGKIEGATNYLVYRSEYNSSTKKWSKWKTLETVDTTSFVDETAVSNVKYKYTVRALNGEFRSYFTASAELLYLKAPTVTAEKIDEGIKVSWTKIEGATSYIIYRSELSEDGKWSKWTKLGTAGEKYTSCKDKTVKEDVTYKYTVRAVSGKLMSYYVASEQILNGVVTESTPEEPKTDAVA